MTTKNDTFQEFVLENLGNLDLYTKAIARAHGKSHPEAMEVRALFEQIKRKLKQENAETPNLEEEMTQLRNITSNYKIPEGVCGTYVMTYEMLSDLDEAYYKSSK